MPKTQAIYYTNLAITLEELGRTEEARAVFESSIAEFPKNGNAHFTFARFLEEREELDAAVEMYQRAIDCEPKRQEFYQRLALVRRKQELLDEAIETTRLSIVRVPAFAPAYRDHAALLRDAGRFDEALPYFRQAVELQSDNHHAMHNIAWTLVEDRDEATAANARWALELASTAKDTDSAFGLLALGAAHYRLGELPAALEAFQGALDSADWREWSQTNRVHRASVRCFQAMVAFQSGDKEHARENLLHAERELGSRAFNNVDFSWKSKLPNADRSAFRLLKEARRMLGESTTFSDRQRRDRLQEMMIAAREVARMAPIKVDGPGQAVSTWDTWSDFSIAYYQSVNWKGSAEEARLAIEFEKNNRNEEGGPNSVEPTHVLLVMAPLLLLERQEVEYRHICEQHPDALRLWTIHPDAFGQSSRIVDACEAERATIRGRPWHTWNRGLAHLRAGNFSKARALLHRHNIYYSSAGTDVLFALAMAIAHHQAGHHADAASSMAEARNHYEDYVASGTYFHNRIEIAVLRAEAEALLGETPDGALDSDAAADSVEPELADGKN